MYQYEKVNKVITDHVRQHGTTIMSPSEIYKETGFKFRINDFCYNWFNIALEKSFGRDCVFEMIDSQTFKLLGAGYPYTGKVYHNPKDGAEYVYGEWQKGKFNRMSDIAEDIEQEAEKLHLKGEEKQQFVKVRVNQGVFRENLLKKYDRCCLCGIKNKGLLMASHIRPWSDSTPEQKLDYNNGLLLCPNHDKLFDKGYITFDDAGNIQISESLSVRDRHLLNISPDMSITITDNMKEYIKYHRDRVFRK